MNTRNLSDPSRDRVTPPVRSQTATWGGLGLIIAFLLRSFLDWQVDPAEAEAWINAVESIVVPAIPVITALYGALRGSWAARKEVTPVDDPYVWDPVTESWQPGVPRTTGGTTVSKPPRRRSERRSGYPPGE
jgi:hypothetical protein